MTIVNSFFTTSLLHWYKEHGRNLPWRETKDPYAIWLSEIILQQTRIQQGWAYWERFMQRWQTVEALAAATEDEVLREWQGLGYYSRARNLHAAARQIVALGGFPQTLEEIRKLKGVGDYTAAAIASFAFGIPAAVVDGNVYRVLSRYFGIDTPINTTEGKKVFAALAQEMLPNVCSDDSENSDYSEYSDYSDQSDYSDYSDYSEPSIGATYNQAIMDFGALQCTPKSPKCGDCPLMETCDAFRTGRVEQLPVKEKKLQVKERRMTYVYIRCNGETAIHRRGAGDIWQGLWEPYSIDNLQFSRLAVARRSGKAERIIDNSCAASLCKRCAITSTSEATSSIAKLAIENLPFPIGNDHRRDDNCQLSIVNCQLLRRNLKHVLTHRVIWADFYLWEVEEKPVLPDDYIWIKEEEIDNYAVPRLIEILLKTLPSPPCLGRE
ncbi:MAG: A/G-specific adenine glycosylase [Prevotella sp.]|nr:A/G-specific adenine glycosylase [Prevotella sp.]